MPADAATRDASPSRGSERAGRILLGLLTVGALGGRLLQARESLWLDELHTAWTAGGALHEVVGRAAAGNHSPPFFWIEWFAARLPGPGELDLRLVSLLAGAALLPLLFAVVRAWTSSIWLALLAAVLVALDPQATYYATEARPYALVQLLALAHLAGFEALVRRPTSARRAMMVAGGALLVHLHYTAILILASEIVWYLWRRRARPAAYAGSSLAIDLAVLALALLPALWFLPSLVARRGLWALWVDQRSLWDGFRMLPWCLTALLSAAAVAAWRRFRHLSSLDPPDARHHQALVLAWLALPVAFAWLATATDTARLLAPRYLAGSAPAAVVLLVLSLSRLPSRRARTFAGLSLALVATASSPVLRGLLTEGRMLAWRTDDWRSALTYFNRHPRHGEGVVMLRSLLIECDDALDDVVATAARAQYCLYPITSMYRIDASRERLLPVVRDFGGTLTHAERSRITAAEGAWVILHGASTTAEGVEREILRSLSATPEARWIVSGRRSFGTVHVLHVARDPGTPVPGL